MGGKVGRPGLTSSTQGRERRWAEPGAGRGRQGSGVGGHRRPVEEGVATRGSGGFGYTEVMVPFPEGHGRPEKPVERGLGEGLGKMCRSRGEGAGGEQG